MAETSRTDQNEAVPQGEIVLSGKRRKSSYETSVTLIAVVLPISILAIIFGYSLMEKYPHNPTLFLIGMGLFVFALILFVSVVLRARSYSWSIYEYRIDINKGVLSRKYQQVWLYEIKDTQLNRNFYDMITNNASIKIIGEGKSVEMRGIADAAKSERIWNLLRSAIQLERGEVKKIWI